MLPKLPNRDGITKWRSAEFRGIRHVPGAGNGDIYDCKGVTGEDYPVLRTVDWAKRKYNAAAKGVYGSYQYGTAEIERIYINSGAVFYRDTQVYADAALTAMQRIIPFNTYALIMPAKLWIRTDVIALVDVLPASANVGDVYGEAYASSYRARYWNGSAWVSLGPMAGPIEHSETASCTFTDGTYAGVSAEGNTIKRSSGIWEGFAVGDAVTVSGAADAENNKTIIIREISGDELRFYENSFTDNSTAAQITVARTMPDLDFLCVNENRVWGCRGQTIYASKLGDFRNWNVFDALASDSYAVDVLTGGDFTGCVSFLGYPVFFKRRGIYKVYGNKPSNFEVTPGADTGCVCGDTLAIAGETLYYLSTRGVMSYNGGIPQPVSGDLGSFITGAEAARGASDGNIYYFFYLPAAGDTATSVFEFDPAKGVWHKQVYAGKLSYAYRGHKGAVFVTDAGHRYGDITSSAGMSNAWEVEFAELDVGFFGSKYPVRAWLRAASAADITVTVKYNAGSFEAAFTVPHGGKAAQVFPVPIRRCDRFSLKLSGTGNFTLWALEIETRAQQTSRKGG